LEKNKAGSHSEELQHAELKLYAVRPLAQSDMKTYSTGNTLREMGEAGRAE